MSKLSDYSKFDHLVDSDDDEQDEVAVAAPQRNIPTQQPAAQPQPVPPQPQHTKDPKTGRYVFTHGTQKVYEWEQSLDSVTLYIDAPPDRKAKDFRIEITTKHLKVGLKDHDRFFLEEDFHSLVDTTESCWYLEDNGVLQIVLTKQHRGETWTCVLKGGETNAAVQEELQQQLLLERFQEENPGMDFRGATFNGSAPDPRNFMGGIGYK